MNGRELIKCLEACDLDKEVAIVVDIVSEDEYGYGAILRQINSVTENKDLITLQ